MLTEPRRKLYGSVLACVFFLCPMVCCAQQASPKQDIPSLRTQSNVVFVPTLVKDRAGKLVFGLQAKDFMIEDDGVEQQVSMDEAEPQEAVSLVIAIQSGRSALFEFQRMKGISAMLDQIVSQPQVQTAIVVFDSNVNLAQDFSFDSASTETFLKSMMEGPRRNMPDGDRGGAAILDAMHYSVKLLGKQPEDSRRVLLLISETRDHGSHAVTIDDVVTAISESNAVVYTLAFSPTASTAMDTLRGEWDSRTDPAGWNLDILRLLKMSREAMRKNASKETSSLTGGEYELFTSSKNFEKFMTEFANHLHNRYLLRFEPKNPHFGLHEVRVRLRRAGNNMVLARRSYWVNEPEATEH
ncbi:MAG TPA: VWA domain-containing protein [Candidatus Binatia bacterium]|nr:VWA domain-containing protein [Candidatus Binatia bacterium]